MSLAFQKIIPVGDVGQVSLSEAAGVMTISFSAQHNVGGGKTTCVVKSTEEVDLPTKAFVDAAFALLETKLAGVQAAVGVLESLRIMVDTQL